LAVLSSSLPASFSWLGHLTFDLYRRLEADTLSNPGGELRRLKFLLDTCLNLVPEQQAMPVLQFFSAYISHIANHYDGQAKVAGKREDS
jgi:hypothetical protein